MRCKYLENISISIAEFNESSEIYKNLLNEFYEQILKQYCSKGLFFRIKSKTPIYKECMKDEAWDAAQLVLNRWLQWVIHQNRISSEDMLSQIPVSCDIKYPLVFGLTKIDLAEALISLIENAAVRPIELNLSTVLGVQEDFWLVTRS